MQLDNKILKQKIIHIRLTDDEYLILLDAVKSLNLSISNYVRKMIFQKPIITKIDWNSVGELRRQGGLLKHYFNETGGQNKKITEKILKDIQSIIKKIESSFEA